MSYRPSDDDPPDLGLSLPSRAGLKRLFSKTERDAEFEKCVIKYKGIRILAREQLEEEILRAFRIRVDATGINDDALRAVRNDWTPRGRKQSFEWEDQIVPTLCKSHPRRLDLALWSSGELCGLVAGRLSDSKEWMSLTFLEGSPNPTHPLKRRVAPIALVAADIYASLVQDQSARSMAKPKIRLLNPLKEAMGTYERIGYDVVTQANGYTFATSRGK